MTTNIITPYDAEVKARALAASTVNKATGVPKRNDVAFYREALSGQEGYRRGFTAAEARYAPLLEALLELEEAFSFADLPSSGRQDFEERLWALRPRVQDAIAAAEKRTP